MLTLGKEIFHSSNYTLSLYSVDQSRGGTKFLNESMFHINTQIISEEHSALDIYYFSTKLYKITNNNKVALKVRINLKSSVLRPGK